MSDDPRVELRGLNVGWSDGRTDRLFARVQTRIGRRRVALRALLTAATLVSVVCVGIFALRWGRGSGAPVADRALQGAPVGMIRLREGSEIHRDSLKSELRVVEESAARVRVELVRGEARYSVVPNAGRVFEVRAGAVTVTVVGTEFSVERRSEKTWVEVRRGKVRVSWAEAGEPTFLTAGQSGLFPLEPAPPSNEIVAGPAAESEAADTQAAPAKDASQTYRAHVARHDYRGAYAVLSRNPGLAGDTVKDLLVAADVARLSDHPAEAVPYLQRILRDHAKDERAPLAAFTLGRTLSGIGRKRDAMNTFGRVYGTWPRSPLAEDALLRQAEVAAQLGERATLTRIVERYERDYPNGRRRAEVRRFAGLP